MRNEDRVRFDEAMLGLSEVWGREVSSSLGDIYFAALQEHDIEAVLRAMFDSVKSCRYFPKPSEILDIITGGERGLADAAQIEATKVIEAVSRGKSDVDLDDPVSRAVVQVAFGGMARLRETLNVAAEPFFIKDFRGYYEAYSRRGVASLGRVALECGNDKAKSLIGDLAKSKALR